MSFVLPPRSRPPLDVRAPSTPEAKTSEDKEALIAALRQAPASVNSVPRSEIK